MKIAPAHLDAWFAWIDGYNKFPKDKRREIALEFGATESQINIFENFFSSLLNGLSKPMEVFEQTLQEYSELEIGPEDDKPFPYFEAVLSALSNAIVRSGNANWMNQDTSIVRGLAYYTGTVFEALADGERAVAGGGRYDNLIELFGGPPTPACGFGMGDVVLGNLLDDKGLMPTGAELMDAVARPQASIRPVAFVVPNGDDDNEPLVHILTANLRRGIESESWLSNDDRKPWHNDRYTIAPMHTRISYKSTRKINKLKADASNQHAKFFVVINAEDNAELTNMDTGESVGSFSVNPAAENYIGQAIAAANSPAC